MFLDFPGFAFMTTVSGIYHKTQVDNGCLILLTSPCHGIHHLHAFYIFDLHYLLFHPLTYLFILFPIIPLVKIHKY
jgi:hypothetical protein